MFGDLLENLLCEITALYAPLELYELDDVARSGHTCRVPEPAAIAIELLHGREVGIAYADDDDRAGHVGQLAYQVDCLWHVMDGTIGQQEKNLVLVLPHG